MKKIFTLIFYFSLFTTLFSEQFTSNEIQKKNNELIVENMELSSKTAKYSKVLTGKVIFEPVKLSDSIVLITDARTLTCIKDNGKLLWEKNLRNPSEAKVYKLANDFIAVIVQKDTQLFIFNQSGVQICHKEFDSRIIGSPVSGFDSRIFIPFEDKIACFSIKGSEKWEIKNEYKSSQLYTFSDGSICVVDKQTNSTKILRYSPFGEKLDELNLQKITLSVNQVPQGIFLIYKNKYPALISVNDDNRMYEKWVFLENKEDSLPVDLNYDRTGIVFADADFLTFYYQFKRNIYFNKIDVSNGELIDKFDFEVDDSFYNYHFNCNKNGYFALNTKTAYFFDNLGTLAWKKELSTEPSEKYLYYVFSTSNDLILCTDSWSLNYFSVHKSDSNKDSKKTSSEPESGTNIVNNYKSYFSRKVYNPFYFNENTQTSLVSEIEKQNYGIEEITYMTNLDYFFDDYFASMNTASFGLIDNTASHEKMIDITSKAITVLFSLETSDFNQTIKNILEKEKNKTILKTTLSGISNFGYDPDFILISQLEVMSGKITPKDELLVPYICDATYAICECMGTQAFEKYGNKIIRNFLQSKYSDKTKEKARNTYVKISKIFKN